MSKLTAVLSAALLAAGVAPVRAQETPKPAAKPQDTAPPDRPMPSPSAEKPVDSTMPSQSPAVGHEEQKAPDTTMSAETKDTKAKTSVSYAGRTSEINKHIGFVDLYIDQAMDSAKALAALGDSDPGKKDNALIQEGTKNLTGAIDKALTHVQHVRTFKSDLAMVAPGTDEKQPSVGSTSGSGANLAKLDELERNLKDARSASKKLTSAKLDTLSTSVDAVASHLMAAHTAFKDIAKWTSYTLLEDTNLATVPVSGQDRDLGTTGTPKSDTAPGATMPDTTSPSATTPGKPGSASPSSISPDTTSTPGDLSRPSPDTSTTSPTPTPTPEQKSKGQTMPGSKPEPVKPAPGGGSK